MEGKCGWPLVHIKTDLLAEGGIEPLVKWSTNDWRLLLGVVGLVRPGLGAARARGQ